MRVTIFFLKISAFLAYPPCLSFGKYWRLGILHSGMLNVCTWRALVISPFLIRLETALESQSLEIDQCARFFPYIIPFHLQNNPGMWEHLSFSFDRWRRLRGWTPCDPTVPELKPGSCWFWSSLYRPVGYPTNNLAPLQPGFKELPNSLEFLFPRFLFSFLLRGRPRKNSTTPANAHSLTSLTQH